MNPPDSVELTLLEGEDPVTDDCRAQEPGESGWRPLNTLTPVDAGRIVYLLLPDRRTVVAGWASWRFLNKTQTFWTMDPKHIRARDNLGRAVCIDVVSWCPTEVGDE